MSGQAIINFTDSVLDQEGNVIKNVTDSKIKALGIKTNKELEDRKDEFPDIALSNILDIMFDFTPLPSNKIFALYNNVLIDIKKAIAKKQKTILMDRSDLETFMKLFEKSIDGKPEHNRRLAFICEKLDESLANCLKT